MTRTALRVLIPAAALLAGAALTGCAKKQAGGGGFQMPPLPVEVAVAERRPVADVFEAVGTIQASDAVTVVSEISGIVTSLPFREGDPIHKGDVIAQIDDDQLRADRDRTRALRDQAEATFDRVKAVVDQGAGAPQDLDDAEASLKVAGANLALAEARLSKARITAPFDGIVGARRVSRGAYLSVGEPITDLAQIRDLRIDFAAPERYLAQLRRGDAVTVSTPAYPGRQLTGTIDVVDPVVNPDSRTARIVAKARNPEELFRPGMSANVRAILSEREDALTIPNEAVFAQGDQNLVFVVQPDSTVARTVLELGTRLADVVEVLKGLEPGDRVVRAGHQKLFDGAKVIPIMSRAAGADSAVSGSTAAGGGAVAHAASTDSSEAP